MLWSWRYRTRKYILVYTKYTARTMKNIYNFKGTPIISEEPANPPPYIWHEKIKLQSNVPKSIWNPST